MKGTIYINYIAFTLISLIFIISPYFRGLFFDYDFYLWEILIHLIFIGFMIASLIINKKFDYTVFIVTLWPLLYFISFFGSEIPNAALEQMFRWMTYALFFIVLYFVSKNSKVRYLLPIVFYLTITWISIFGLLSYWGIVEYQDAVLGNRISSVFQYPNTLATIIGIGILFALINLTEQKEYKLLVFYMLPLVPMLCIFLLTYSRGAMVVFPIAWFIGLTLLNFKSQIKFVLYSLTASLGALFVFNDLQHINEVEYAGFKSLLIITLIISTILVLTNIYLERIHITRKKWWKFLLPLIIVGTGIVVVFDIFKKGIIYNLLPKPLQSRLSTINFETNSVTARFRFNDQAIEMSKEAPLFGLGGDGWRALYFKFQDVPYISSETHNFYLETLLNIGWVGSILFFGIFIYLIYISFKSILVNKYTYTSTLSLASLAGLTMLLLHVIIDFDLSFGTVALIMMWLLTMMIPEDQKIIPRINLSGKKNIIIVVSMLMISVISVVYIGRFYIAESSIRNAPQSLKLADAEDLYLQATKLNPYNTEYKIHLAKIYQNAYYQNDRNGIIKERSISYLEEAYRLEPHQSELLLNIAQVYSNYGEKQTAISYIEKALENDPFGPDIKYSLIYEYTMLSRNLFREGSAKSGEKYAELAIKIYEKQKQIIEEIKSKSIPDKRKIKLNPRIKLYVGESYYYKNNYLKSINLLKDYKSNNNDLLLRAKVILYLSYLETNKQELAEQIMRKYGSSDFEKIISELD